MGLDIHCRGQLYYLLCNINYLAVNPALLIFPLQIYWSKRSTFTQVYSIIEARVVIACFIPSRSRLCCCLGYHIWFHSFSLSLVRVLPFVILSLGVPWLINIMVGLFQLLYRSIQIRLAVNFYKEGYILKYRLIEVLVDLAKFISKSLVFNYHRLCQLEYINIYQRYCCI